MDSLAVALVGEVLVALMIVWLYRRRPDASWVAFWPRMNRRLRGRSPQKNVLGPFE